MKAILVGAGGTTRELLRRLGERWDAVVIDTDASLLESASGIRDFERIVGDGSSGLVLQRAGLDEVDAVIAATSDDDVNLEVIRIARAQGVLRLAAVAADPERIVDYRIQGIPVWAPDSLTARQIEVLLEPRRVASSTFADGKAEAIEFRISPDSPVCGKQLQELHSDAWVIAAVLRGDCLIIPHGLTRIEADDRVTVVGAAASFPLIVRTFTAGESRFPLNFGRNVAVILERESDLDGVIAEAISLIRNSHSEGLLVVHRDPESIQEKEDAATLLDLLGKLESQSEGVEVEFRAVRGDLSVGLAEVARAESVGTIAMTAPEGRRIWGRIQTARLVNAYGELGLPLLMARGRYPYSSVIVPARRTVQGELAARAAIDLAHTTGVGLTGVSAISPAFVGTGDTAEDARRSAAWLREEAGVQGVSVTRRLRRGNPVRIIEEFATSGSLLVIGMPNLSYNPFIPGTSGHLISRVQSSVLLVPPLS